MGGQKWSWNIVLTASLYGVPFLLIFSFVNTVALIWGTTSAVPFWAIVTVLAIWLFGKNDTSKKHLTVVKSFKVGLPLTILGGIAGRRLGSGEFQAPCRTKTFPREIPAIPWYAATHSSFPSPFVYPKTKQSSPPLLFLPLINCLGIGKRLCKCSWRGSCLSGMIDDSQTLIVLTLHSWYQVLSTSNSIIFTQASGGTTRIPYMASCFSCFSSSLL